MFRTLLSLLNLAKNPAQTKQTLAEINELEAQKTRLQQEINQQKVPFRRIVDDLMATVIVIQDGLICFVNPHAGSITGFTHEVLLKKPIHKMVFPDDRHIMELLLNPDRDPSDPLVSDNLRVYSIDGNILWLEAHTSVIEWNSRPAILALLLDITENKLQKNTLQDINTRYREIVDTVADGILTLGLTGRITSCNQTFLNITGYDRDKFIGKHITQIPTLFREDIGHFIKLFSEVLIGKNHSPVIFRWKHRDGSIHWGEARANLIREGGKIVCIQAVLRDTTEQKTSREELAHTQALLHAALDQSPAGIIIADPPDGRIRFANQTALKMRGGDTDSLTGIPFQEHSQNWRLQNAAGEPISFEDFPLTGAIKNGRDQKDFEFIIQHESGEQHIVLGNAAPIRDANNKIIAGIVVFSEITERKQAELALRDSEASLSALINAIPEPAFLVDENLEILVANTSLAERLGQDISQVIGSNPFGHISDQTGIQRRKHIESVFSTREMIQFEDQRNGKTQSNSYYPIIDSDGNVRRVGVLARDISSEKANRTRIMTLLEQTTALNELALSIGSLNNAVEIYDALRKRLDKMITLDSFLILLYDQKDKQFVADYVYGNKLVYNPEEFPPIQLEEEPTSLYHQVLTSQQAHYIPDNSEETGVVELDHVLLPNGTIKSTRPENASPVQSIFIVPMLLRNEVIGLLQVQSNSLNGFNAEDRQFLSVLANLAGLSIQNYQLLERVQQQAEEVGEIIQTVPEGLLLLGNQLQVIRINPAARDFFAALSIDPNINKLENIGPYSIHEILQSTDKHKWFEVTTEHTTARVFELHATQINRAHHESGWVIVIRDLTQERAYVRQIQQQERLAVVGQLAAGIAHDFNNIMVPIILYSEMLSLSPNITAEERKRVATVLDQANRAASLTQQILDFGRRSVMAARKLNLKEFLEEFISLLKRILPESILISWNISPGEFNITADTTRLQQALMNIALNARDAMPDGGSLLIELDTITLAAGKDNSIPALSNGKWVRLQISDTGSGIPTDKLAHVFEPFFTTKEPGKGSGLGLAQVFGIVKQHNGHIEVTSQNGQGTRFTIYFPVTHDQQPSATPDIKSGIHKGNHETILVVEDNDAVRNALETVLESLNYNVISAQGSAEALKIYTEDHSTIDLILCDMVMPGMSGRELFHILKQNHAEVRMVLISGYPLEQQQDVLLAEGILDWIPKPITLKKVTEVLSTVLHD